MPLGKPGKIIKAAGVTITGQAAAVTPGLRIELLENRQAVVEGCKGVLEYSELCIRLSSGRFIIKFSGEGLALKTFNSSSAIVEGKITNVEFS